MGEAHDILMILFEHLYLVIKTKDNPKKEKINGLFFQFHTHVHLHIRKNLKTAKLAKFAKSPPQKSVKDITLKQVRIPGSALRARPSSGSNLQRFPVRRGTAPAPNSSNIWNWG